MRIYQLKKLDNIIDKVIFTGLYFDDFYYANRVVIGRFHFWKEEYLLGLGFRIL